MQQDAIEIVQASMQKFDYESDIAEFIKTEFDSKHGEAGEWHCFVGKSFGSSFSPKEDQYIYL